MLTFYIESEIKDNLSDKTNVQTTIQQPNI